MQLIVPWEKAKNRFWLLPRTDLSGDESFKHAKPLILIQKQANMDSEKHQNQSFVALQQEKALLEQNRRDELAALEEPKLFGILDSRSLLLGYLIMGAVPPCA